MPRPSAGTPPRRRAPLCLRIAEEDQHCITDDLSIVPPYLSAIADISVKYSLSRERHLLRLQPLRGSRKILDVGEEDRQLLALGVDGDILLVAEDALDRPAARCTARSSSTGWPGSRVGFELAVHPPDQPALRCCSVRKEMPQTVASAK